jgi:hypothetical protein
MDAAVRRGAHNTHAPFVRQHYLLHFFDFFIKTNNLDKKAAN